MGYTERVKKKTDQQSMLQDFLLKGKIIYAQDELVNVEITEFELFADRSSNEQSLYKLTNGLQELLKADWFVLRDKIKESIAINQNVSFHQYFKCFDMSFKVLIMLPVKNDVEIVFVGQKEYSELSDYSNSDNYYLDSLSRINYAILHYGDLKLVSKVIKDELHKYFRWMEFFLDSSFTADFQNDFQKISGESFRIINFENRECFAKLKKWKNFFILNKNSKTCQNCNEESCEIGTCIIIPLKYIDDFYGGVVVSFNPEDIYNVDMIEFLQEVAHNYSSLLYYYALSHRPLQAKNKIENYYSRLKERNAELEKKNEELQMLNEENRKAREKAEESDRLKLAFLGNMSHEIRTPINGIVGFSQLLKNCEIDPKASSYLDIVIDSSHRLMKLMDNIISYSKLQANQVENELLSCSLNKELDDILLKYTHQDINSECKNVEVKKNYSLEAPADNLKLSIVNLKGILNNLLDNACKFTHEGCIQLSYKMYSDYLLFRIEDTGVGIPSDKKNVIFRHFRQGDESKVREYGGLGLGLSIVKELIEVVNGKIWVESNENAGTIFYFAIPYEIPETNTVISKPTAKLDINDILTYTKKHIVVVENDPESSDSIKGWLDEKYLVNVLKTGEEALEYFGNYYSADLVLVDIRLPDMSGVDLIKQIKEVLPRIPVLAQIADLMEKDRKKCIIAGCDDFMIKPWDKEELINKVEEFI